MVKLNLTLAAAIVAHGAIAATVDEQSLFANLLKRQEPGTPKYKCHEACGGAILAARAAGDDVCKDDAFLSNYNSCLKCAGPDSFDIWNIYGRTLSGFGESCGLSTTPEAGNSGGAESTTPAAPTSTEAAEPSITSSVAGPTTTPDQATTASPEPTSSGPVEPVTSSSAASVTAAPTYSTTAAGEATQTSLASTPSGNGTAPTATVVSVNAAQALSSNFYGLCGAAALGALYAIAH